MSRRPTQNRSSYNHHYTGSFEEREDSGGEILPSRNNLSEIQDEIEGNSIHATLIMQLDFLGTEHTSNPDRHASATTNPSQSQCLPVYPIGPYSSREYREEGYSSSTASSRGMPPGTSPYIHRPSTTTPFYAQQRDRRNQQTPPRGHIEIYEQDAAGVLHPVAPSRRGGAPIDPLKQHACSRCNYVADREATLYLFINIVNRLICVHMTIKDSSRLQQHIYYQF
ncbi:hypothetical protein BU17DRAFT_69520 [Hysterangium stoloniferum]|nr:hypothetical protein BU17DRAFT_69520 [Hysterangium stoloniferum]